LERKPQQRWRAPGCGSKQVTRDDDNALRDRPSKKHTDRAPTVAELTSAARHLHQLLGVLVDAMNAAEVPEPRPIWGAQWRGNDEAVWTGMLTDPSLRERLQPVGEAVEAFLIAARQDVVWRGNGVLFALVAREYVRGGMSAEEAVETAQQ